MLTDNNSVIKSTKEFLYMKAIRIVRRIEERGIITPRIYIAKTR